MPVMTDMDLSSLRIQQNLNSTPSVATFTLARRHDKLDYDLLGNYDEITNQNKIQIYDGSILLFTGYITQIRAISSTDTVEITAEDVRCKLKNISMELFWGAQLSSDIPEYADYYFYNYSNTSTKSALDSLFSYISGYISGHDNLDFYFVPEYTSQTSDCGSLLDTLITSSANINWYIDANEYLRFQKIEQGTTKNLALSGLNSQRHIYDTILNDVTLNKITSNGYYGSLEVHFGPNILTYYHKHSWSSQFGERLPEWYISPFISKSNELNWTWFTYWKLDANDPIISGRGGWIPNPHKYNWITGIWEGIAKYVGEGVEPFPNHRNSKGEKVEEYFDGQYLDWSWNGKDFGFAPVTIGDGSPTKKAYFTSYGRKWSNRYLSHQTIDGVMGTKEEWLCEIQEENYDYTNFALDSAYFELSQNNKLLTEATITLLLDAFEYYGISFSDLINLTNTIQSGIYQNNNGFPLNISSYSIDFSNRTVTLNLTNYGKTYRQRTGNITLNHVNPRIYKVSEQLSSEEIKDLE